MADGLPFGLIEGVDVADGFVEGRVALEARVLVDFETFLVEEEV